MSTIKIKPNLLTGNIAIPPSKSLIHRVILSAALSDGESKLEGINMSDDIKATLGAVRALGCSVIEGDNYVLIKGPLKHVKSCEINANESGSTLRFFIPLALVFAKEVTFYGAERLMQRPLTPYFEIFDKLGVKYTLNKNSLKLSGSLVAGEYNIRGDVSSQFITGLIFALSVLDEKSTINITTDLESKSYVDLTLQAMEKFNAFAQNNNYKSFSVGNCKYLPYNYIVEGDYSQAAFFLVAAAIGNNVTCTNLSPESLQGDMEILDILKRCGCDVIVGKHTIEVKPNKLHGICVDASQIPDLVPILTVLLSFCEGESKIINAARVRLKESDRLNAIATELNKMGASVIEGEESLIIKGVNSFKEASVSAHNDHRIAMSIAIAATRSIGNIEIENKECVNKSMPDFWDKYKELGGVYIV